MRGESYFLGMRGLGHYSCIPEDGGIFLLYSIDRDKDIKRCFAEEDFHEITDFNDLPNSLFACNVHQSVFEGEDSKVEYWSRGESDRRLIYRIFRSIAAPKDPAHSVDLPIV